LTFDEKYNLIGRLQYHLTSHADNMAWALLFWATL